MSFTDRFLRRPVLAIVVTILIVLFGIKGFNSIATRQYPTLETSTILISTRYPGASSDLMQGFVTQPISEAVASVEGIDYLSSTTTQGLSVVTVRMMLNYDSMRALTDVMSKVNAVKYRLPEGAYDPVIKRTSGGFTAVAYIGFASTTRPLYEISDYIHRVAAPMLSGIEGVSEISYFGEQRLSMRLWLDPEKLAANDMTGEDVAQAIRENNFQAAPGRIRGVYTISNINLNTDLKTVEEFRDMVLRSTGGRVIRVRDIGRAELGPDNTDTSSQTSTLRPLNGKPTPRPSIFVGLEPSPTGNPLTIISRLNEIMPKLKATLPPGIDVRVPYETAHFIQASIDEVTETFIEALLIVILVIYLSLGTVRAVIVPIATIPLSMLGAVGLMYTFGFSLNLLTLLAMVLSIGLVVDDAIVVIENVHRHIEEGKSPFDAALLGAREVAGPVVAMTLTLTAVYAPIAFMGGLTGTLFREFALTLAGSVIVSGVVALTLSPLMSAKLLKAKEKEGFMERMAERAFGFMTARYETVLDFSLRYRWVPLGTAAVIFLLIPVMLHVAQSELAPNEDQDIVYTAVKAPQYANLHYVETYAQTLYEKMSEIPEGHSHWQMNGIDGIANSVGGVNLDDWGTRKRNADQIQMDLQQRVASIQGTSVFVFQMGALPGSTGGLPVQMVVRSDDSYRNVFGVMSRLREEASKSGLFAVVDSDLAFDNPVVRVTVDRTKANALGIRMERIGNALNTLIGENYVNRFGYYGRSYDVIPQAVPLSRLTPDALKTYYMRDQNGHQVPLSALASVRVDVEPNRLPQFGQQNSATFQAILAKGVTMGDAVSFLKAKAAEFPPGYSYDWQSDSRQYVQEGNALIFAFLFALIAIYLVLSVQYNSFTDPVIILVSVPLSVFGALIPLALGVTTLNIYTEIGLITLIGLVSKHGILMVEFANEILHRDNVDRRTAIETAAAIRFRPIIMTTAAMVVGLAPLVIATGAGANSRFGLGTVIVVGMIVGTSMTLFVLPSVYTVIRPRRGKTV